MQNTLAETSDSSWMPQRYMVSHGHSVCVGHSDMKSVHVCVVASKSSCTCAVLWPLDVFLLFPCRRRLRSCVKKQQLGPNLWSQNWIKPGLRFSLLLLLSAKGLVVYVFVDFLRLILFFELAIAPEG